YAVVASIAGYGLLAFRDPYGIRPLVVGQTMTEQGVEYIVASESVTLDTLGFKIIRDVAPGEAVLIDESGNFHSRQCAEDPQLNPCIFEFVYLARPDSVIDGISVYESRRNMGKSLADKIRAAGIVEEIDVVMPIPDSSRPSALEVATKLGKPYREGFIKNRYIGRTFIMPGQEMRKKSVRQKLNAMPIEFAGKNVLLVDDSIVRGTTSREIVQMARESGAKKVFFASAAPPVRYPNVYGIDMPTRSELIATGRTEAEIAQAISADAVIYQDLEALIEDVRKLNPSIKRFDCSCFDGVYVTGDVSQEYLDGIAAGRGNRDGGPETRLSSYQLDLGLSRID
ncbi:MAG TPA: amidophosphoribosyltransferase, partial [Usitatibacter sp.]|nr:amidophosphoribosyltransferase [Usitatibacter sp.]